MTRIQPNLAKSTRIQPDLAELGHLVVSWVTFDLISTVLMYLNTYETYIILVRLLRQSKSWTLNPHVMVHYSTGESGCVPQRLVSGTASGSETPKHALEWKFDRIVNTKGVTAPMEIRDLNQYVSKLSLRTCLLRSSWHHDRDRLWNTQNFESRGESAQSGNNVWMCDGVCHMRGVCINVTQKWKSHIPNSFQDGKKILLPFDTIHLLVSKGKGTHTKANKGIVSHTQAYLVLVFTAWQIWKFQLLLCHIWVIRFILIG